MTGLTIIPTSIQIVIFQIETPSKVYLEFGYLQTKPFYREVWFVVALAASSIVIIIMVVAILCVKSKTYKYKGKFFTSCIPGTGSLKPPLTLCDPWFLDCVPAWCSASRVAIVPISLKAQCLWTWLMPNYFYFFDTVRYPLLFLSAVNWGKFLPPITPHNLENIEIGETCSIRKQAYQLSSREVSWLAVVTVLFLFYHLRPHIITSYITLKNEEATL